MQIVIDIPDDMYYAIEHRYWSAVNETVLLSCVANGTPLPKGHGRLVDADDLLDNTCLDEIPTIIEADKAESEDEDGEYQRQIEQLEHDILYEPTFNPEDGSM